MKTAYYTFTVWDEGGAMAAGCDAAEGASRRTALVRRPGPESAPRGDNIVDLTAWRAEGPDAAEEGPLDGEGWYEEERADFPAPRARRRRRALFAAELASTLSVAAAALAIVLRVLAF